MGMKHYLILLWISVLMFSGISVLAQKPTVTLAPLQDRFCELGDGTFVFTFTGSGDYDLTYIRDEKTQVGPIQINGSNSYTLDLPNLSSTTTIRVSELKDVNKAPDEQYADNLPQSAIYIDQMPSPTINEPHRVCDNEVHLSGQAGLGGSLQWSVTDDAGNAVGGSFDDETLANPVYTAPAEGNYKFYLVETNGACVSAPYEYPYAHTDKPRPQVGTIADVIICQNEQATIVLQELTADDSAWPVTVNHTNGPDDLSETGKHEVLTPVFAAAGTSQYTITSLVDNDGCVTDLINGAVDITVEALPLPNAGADIEECTNEVQLQAILQAGETGQWSYSQMSYFSDANDPNSNFTVPVHLQEPNDVHALTWEVTGVGTLACKASSTVDVTLHKVPEAEIITDPQKLYRAKTIELEAKTPSDGLIGTWTVESSSSELPKIEFPNEETTLVTNLAYGKHKFFWTVVNGSICEAAVASVDISNEGLFKTSGFSPDGDNVNDKFVIGGAKNVANNKLTVFNVNGKTVFETTNFCRDEGDYPDGWDGESNTGYDIVDGTYYYIFTGDGIEPIKHYLIIKGKR